MKPYFSIIIPTLNEERYLPKLLEDLLNQTEKNFEVIVVDGKSTDKTIDVCKHFMKNIPSKIIISNKRNVAYQRNYGTKFSKGSYLFFLDADSRISNNFVYKLKKFIINNKGLLFIPYLTSGASDKKYRTLLDLSNMLAESSIFFDKKFSLGGSMIIEKNFFGLLGGFNENLYLAEDHELIQRAHFWGVSPRFLRNIKITASFRRFKNEGEIKIFIKDNGIGLSEERKDKLLTDLLGKTTPGTNREKGTGLGLSLCVDFVERMGGDIKVESAGKDMGTTFIVSLPAGEQEITNSVEK